MVDCHILSYRGNLKEGKCFKPLDTSLKQQEIWERGKTFTESSFHNLVTLGINEQEKWVSAVGS